MKPKITYILIDHTWGDNTVEITRGGDMRRYPKVKPSTLDRINRLQTNAYKVHFTLFSSGPVISLLFI